MSDTTNTAPTSFLEVQSCSPSQVAGSYVYSVLPVLNDKLVALTSADELQVLDGSVLKSLHRYVDDVPKPASCMTTCPNAESIIVCVGGDGVVAVFDIRSKGRAAHFKIDKSASAVAYGNQEVAVGSEVSQSQATISIWDERTQNIRWRTTENNDDVTALQYHPKDHKHLLSGSDDGLVSVFDTAVDDENDSLIQAFDHGPIHKTGYLSHSAIYALSADQQLSIHPRNLPELDDVEVFQPVVFGDVRPITKCDYVIDILGLAHQPYGYMVTGSHVSEQHVDLIPIVAESRFSLSTKSTLRLEVAHDEEIVRSVYLDKASETIYTAGEDGCVKAFRASIATPMTARNSTSKVRNRRFKPY